MAEPKRPLSASWTYSLAQHDATALAVPGWRHRLAQWLRRQADALDGRRSLATLIATTPTLDARTQLRVIQAGYGTMKAALAVECEHEAFEQVLRQVHPRLY